MHRPQYLPLITWAVCIVQFFAVAFAADSGNAPNQAATASINRPDSKPKFTISKETTLITQPLSPDGFPDYLSALDERSRVGVTVDSNAAVPMVEAIGPTCVREPFRSIFFQRIGVDALPVKGNYLVNQFETIKLFQSKSDQDEKDRLLEQFESALSHPWTERNYPVVALWLAQNQDSLKLAIAASQRASFYRPFVPNDGSTPLFELTSPVPKESRELAELLLIRAMKELSDGNVDAAAEQIMACHRLARSIGKSPTLVGALFALAIENMAINGDIALAHYGHLTGEQNQQIAAKFNALSPVTKMVDKIDLGERFNYLDAVLHVAKEGPQIMSQTPRDQRDIAADAAAKEHWATTGRVNIDWDVPLRMGNEWFDRLIEIGNIGDIRKRNEAIAKFNGDLDELRSRSKSFGQLLGGLLTTGSTRDAVSHAMGAILVHLMVAGVPVAIRAEDRARLGRQVTEVAFALSAYRSDHGAYPEKLDALVPKYIAAIPDDLYSPQPKPINYRQDGEAYVIWSVFLNGVDDDGHNADDDQAGDDLTYRPVALQKQAVR